MSNRARKQEILRKTSDRYLRNYQKLSVYVMIPALLDFVAAVLGSISKSYHLMFSFGVTRWILPSLTNAGVPYLGFLPSLGFAAIFVALAMFGARGKAWAPFLSAGLYLADTIAYAIYFAMFLSSNPGVEDIIAFIAHGLFLVLFAFLIVYYFKTLNALKKEKAI